MMPIGPLGAPAFILVDECTLQILALLPEAPAEHTALMEWCELHGMIPGHMPATQTIVRDLERCRVVYDEFDATPEEMADRAVHWRSYPGVPPTRRVHAQGETPPMPFPDVILAHLHPPSRETA